LAEPFSSVRDWTPRRGAVVRSRLKPRRGTVRHRLSPQRGDARMPYTAGPRGSASALTSHRCAEVGLSSLVLQVFFAEVFRDPRFMLPDPDFRLDGSPILARCGGGMRVRFESGAKLS
jgi:hypothetical protein